MEEAEAGKKDEVIREMERRHKEKMEQVRTKSVEMNYHKDFVFYT